MMSDLARALQTDLVAIAPRRLAEEFAESLELQVLPLPLKQNSRTCYLSCTGCRCDRKAISGWKSN